MFNSFPQDVVVLSAEALTLARFEGKGKKRQLVRQHRTRLGEAFTPAPVTPLVTDAAALTEAVRRLKKEAGRLEKTSLLLPDSWFRMNLIEVAELPNDRAEAQEMIRWALKRTLPIAPEQLRLAWEQVGRNDLKRKVMVVSAVAKSLDEVERAFREAGVELVLIEPVGLNLWNAVAASMDASPVNRLLLHIGDDEFTTALFRGAEPLFLRSRNLSGDRSISHEIRLTASFLRESLQMGAIDSCHVAMNRHDAELFEVIGNEFGAAATPVVARIAETDLSPELIACTGVFTS